MLKQDKNRLIEEQHLSVGQLVKWGLKFNEDYSQRLVLGDEIKEHQLLVTTFLEKENTWIDEIKFLSTIREKMARTASQASAQARETSEELKVNELLILDLTKKQQEIEFRLNAFKNLYEEVKNQRNKYVSQIQSSS